MNKPTPPTWWARNPAREVFDVGPFPSREDAVNDAPELMGLQPGTVFEVGEMRPFFVVVPDTIMHTMDRVKAEHRGEANALRWLRSFETHPRRQELVEALDLVLNGWLAKHDMAPRFGHVVNVSTHTHGEVVPPPGPFPPAVPAIKRPAELARAAYALANHEGTVWSYYDNTGTQMNYNTTVGAFPAEILTAWGIKVVKSVEEILGDLPL